MTNSPKTYDEYVAAISKLRRDTLIGLLERSNRVRRIHVVYGGPRNMSKDEIISELARRWRENWS